MVRPLSILRMEGGEYGVARVRQTVADKSLTPIRTGIGPACIPDTTAEIAPGRPLLTVLEHYRF
jgi:hypothetical protein